MPSTYIIEKYVEAPKTIANKSFKFLFWKRLKTEFSKSIPIIKLTIKLIINEDAKAFKRIVYMVMSKLYFFFKIKI